MRSASPSVSLHQRRAGARAFVAALLVLAVMLLAGAGTALAAPLQPPVTIKVARRTPANDPNGRIYRVDTVDFRTYCARVLSHEWAPPSSFSDEALKAGALAVREYAWYWTTRETKLADVRAWGADVDDSVNYQVYMDWDYGPRYHDAVDAVWPIGFTRDGQIFQASYYAGSYNGEATDGYHMTQWGSQYLADQGRTYDEIVNFYYPGVELTSGAIGDATASGGVAGTGPASLDAVGPVLFAQGHHEVGDKLRFEFTLRNMGARKATWASVRLALRGPDDQVRDAGLAGPITLAGGELSYFTATRRLDLEGRWIGWLVVETDQGLELVGDGAPFSFDVGASARSAAASAKASTASKASGSSDALDTRDGEASAPPASHKGTARRPVKHKGRSLAGLLGLH